MSRAETVKRGYTWNGDLSYVVGDVHVNRKEEMI